MVKVRKVKRKKGYTKRKSKYEKGFHDGFQTCLELEKLRRNLEDRLKEKTKEKTKENKLEGKKVFYCLSDEGNIPQERTCNKLQEEIPYDKLQEQVYI